MLNALNIASSGLLAATAQLNVTADNIANLNTPGYQQQSVGLYSNGADGVAVGEVEPTSTPDDGPNGQPTNNVDLATQSVNLITAKLLYNANAAIVKTVDQNIGTLLNVMDNVARGTADS